MADRGLRRGALPPEPDVAAEQGPAAGDRRGEARGAGHRHPDAEARLGGTD